MPRILKTLPSDAVYDVGNYPIGKLFFIASKVGLHWILWESDLKNKKIGDSVKALNKKSNQEYIKTAKKQLDEYFEGQRTEFKIPLVFNGTPFQETAWEALAKIPFGKTVSYQDQARALGNINKVRAVGGANGKNPFSIVIPCHRVIAKNGNLQGFGGGLDIKKYLIKHEQKVINLN